MLYRKIGNTGIEVSILSMGSWNTYNRMLFEDAVAFVRGAHELGVTFFDTSFYPIGPHETRSGPHTEVIFGRILEATGIPRDRYVLTEKLWFYSYPEQNLDDQMNRALFRLHQEYADVISVAMPRTELDLTQVLSEIAAIIKSGRARTWSAMNWTAEYLLKAHLICGDKGWPLPQMVQIKYSVLRRNVVESEEWQALFASTPITLQPSDSLEGGILAGKIHPEREIGSDNGKIRERFIARADEYRAIATEYGASMAQLSLAFCLAHPKTTSVLSGVSSLEQLKDNIGAIALAEKYGSELGASLASFADPAHHTDKDYWGRLPPDDLGGFKDSYVRPVK